MSVGKAAIEAVLQGANLELSPDQVRVFKEQFTPLAEQWMEEYKMVPFTLTEVWLKGFVAAFRCQAEDALEYTLATINRELNEQNLVLMGKLSTLEEKLALSERQRIGLVTELERAGNVVQLARQIGIDQEKLAKQGEGANLQLYCPDCKAGAGDEEDKKTGYLEECPRCQGKGPFIYSWELAGLRGVPTQ